MLHRMAVALEGDAVIFRLTATVFDIRYTRTSFSPV
jgi:hypothetical protein